MYLLQNANIRLSETLQNFMEKHLGTSPMYVPLLLSLFIIVVLFLVVLCQRDSYSKENNDRRKELGRNSRSNNSDGTNISTLEGKSPKPPSTDISDNASNDLVLSELKNLLIEKMQEMDRCGNNAWKDITTTISDNLRENDVVKEITTKDKSLYQFQLNVHVSVSDIVGFFWDTSKKPGKTIKAFKVLNRSKGNPNYACRIYHQMFPSFGNQVLSLSERDLVCAEALFKLNDGRIAYVAKSVNETADIRSQLVKIDKVESVRVDLKFSIYIFESKGENKCLVTRFVEMDYKLPWWIPSGTLRKEQIRRPLKTLKKIEKIINSNDFVKVTNLPKIIHIDIHNKTNLGTQIHTSSNNSNSDRSSKNSNENKDIDALIKQVEEVDSEAENAQTNIYIALGLTALTCIVYMIRR